MIYAIIGASGSGKDSVCRDVFYEHGIEEAISSTTRKMRKGESENNSYKFVDEINIGEFNDSPVKDDSHRGSTYWTTLDEFVKSPNVYRTLSRKGVLDVIKFFTKENVVVIYIYSNQEIISERLIKRDGLESAKQRMLYNFIDFSYDDIDIADYVIVNNDLDKSKQLLRNIIQLNI